MKRVIIAETCCLCYGAERSINKTYEALNSGLNVVLFKEILHNNKSKVQVIQQLLIMQRE